MKGGEAEQERVLTSMHMTWKLKGVLLGLEMGPVRGARRRRAGRTVGGGREEQNICYIFMKMPQ